MNILALLRRHQRRVLIPLAIVVTIAMVFLWGGSGSWRDILRRRQDPLYRLGVRRHRRSELELAAQRLRAASHPRQFAQWIDRVDPNRFQRWLDQVDLRREMPAPVFSAWLRQIEPVYVVQELRRLPRGGMPPEARLTRAQFVAFRDYLLPLGNARRTGFTVSDARLAEDVNAFIRGYMVVQQDETDPSKAYDGYLRQHRLTRAQFEQTRRDLLLIRKYADLVAGALGVSASVEDAYLQHCMDEQTVDVDVVAFPVKDFEDQIEPVTIEDAREEYAQRYRLPRTEPYRPAPQRFPSLVLQRPVEGALFTEPLARVEYLLAEAESFQGGVQVEPQEIADYYDKHRETDFRVEPKKEDEEKEEDKEGEESGNPDAEKSEEKEEAGSAPKFKPLDEVRDEIVRRLTDQKSREAAKKALEKAVEEYNACAPLREILIDRGPPRPTPGCHEDDLSPAGAPEETEGEAPEPAERPGGEAPPKPAGAAAPAGEAEEPKEEPARAIPLAELAEKHGLKTGRTELLDEKAMEKLPVFEGLGYAGGLLSARVFGEEEKEEDRKRKADVTGRLSEPCETKAGYVSVTLRAYHAARKQTLAEARGRIEEDLAGRRAGDLAEKACDGMRQKLLAGESAPPERVESRKDEKARGRYRAVALLSVGQVTEPLYDGEEKVYRLLVLRKRTSPDRAAFLKDREAVERARSAFARRPW